MKRLVSSFLAVLLLFSVSALEKETEALNIFNCFPWKTRIQRLEEKCEKEKVLEVPLNEQKSCIMLGCEKFEKEIARQFFNNEKLKESLQSIWDITYQAYSDMENKLNDIKLKFFKGDISFSEAEKLSNKAYEDDIDNLKNKKEINQSINLCNVEIEKLSKKCADEGNFSMSHIKPLSDSFCVLWFKKGIEKIFN